MIRIFDPCRFQSAFAIRSGEKDFPHVRSLFALRRSCYKSPSTAYVCICKLAPPDYVNLVERSFSTNAKCPCISVTSRCTVCALRDLSRYRSNLLSIRCRESKSLLKYVYVDNNPLNEAGITVRYYHAARLFMSAQRLATH